MLASGKAMKSFLKRLAGGRCSFRGLGMGETAALSLSEGMRRGQDSPLNKLLKKQAREPWNERKGFIVFAYFNSVCFAALKQKPKDQITCYRLAAEKNGQQQAPTYP
jgi:hypothetical protein